MDWNTLPSGDLSHSNEIGIEKMPAPTAGIFDTPVSCGVAINSEWLSFIIARLEILTDPRAWLGEEETANTAAQQIELLLEALAESQACLYPQPEILNPLTSTTVQINIPDDPVYAEVFFEKMAELATPDVWQGSEETAQLIADVWTEVLDTAEQNFGSGEAVMPASFRMNGGVIEYQPYGGTGWTALGDACPCPEPTYSPEYSTDDPDPVNRRCAIATGIVEWLWSKGDDVATAISVASDLAGAIDGVLVLFLPVYLAVDAVTDYVREIVEAEVGQFQLYMSTDNKELHQQWLYCHMTEENLTELTQEAWAAYKQWVYDESVSGADVGGILFHSYLQGYSTEAINDRARIASYGGGNCVGFECAGWEKVFDFRISSPASQGWTNMVSAGTFTWVSGTGCVANTVQLLEDLYRKYIRLELDWDTDATVTEVEILYSAVVAAPAEIIWLRVRLNETQLQQINGHVATGTDRTELLEVSHDFIDEIQVNVEIAENSTDPTNVNNSSLTLKSITLRGIGANPF